MATASGHTSAIRAKKVIGTNVKDRAGNKIGSIEDIVLDKQSNAIMFAVVGFGGFLGMAEKYHPIPWSALDYQEVENAYVVGYSKEQLQGAPAGSRAGQQAPGCVIADHSLGRDRLCLPVVGHGAGRLHRVGGDGGELRQRE